MCGGRLRGWHQKEWKINDWNVRYQIWMVRFDIEEVLLLLLLLFFFCFSVSVACRRSKFLNIHSMKVEAEIPFSCTAKKSDGGKSVSSGWIG
ncbi:hypothetical protein BDV27DRAFT_29934 [Aspergillus caelatus]|uniref:Uncharacterized protein n=1 Tax=Aspergillus caelatus TaxID=61420 RepID=A0A5N7AFZ1_9EURO|nr:uncharacterized protein BDV27DRAFT_29934 [Aspergillus caelatus]KAE8368791.1 hypothetical protein BDV27DRAFT_29934 [Aspergillus caelatus]